jgi:hypothetical protein
LTTVVVPNSVVTIEEGAFSGCDGLTSVVIGNSVTTIGAYAFFACTGLTRVTIPHSVTVIRGSAFCDCSGLSEVTNLNPVPQDIVSRWVFLGVDTDACTLKVPAGSVEDYKAADGWKEFRTIVAAD